MALLDAGPFVALPLLTLCSFAIPPFKYRGPLCSTLIAITNYACIVSPWPPNSGPTRPMRYGMTGSWLFVLPALERLLLHDPEQDFWRLDEEKKPNKGRPREWTWQKLCWAFALVSSPRGVGWNFGGRRPNAARQAMRHRGTAKWSFVLQKLTRAVLSYLTLDGVVAVARRYQIPMQWAWDPTTLGRIAFVEVLMAMSVYATMTLQYEIVAAISVGFGSNKPEDWPPLFGKVSSCYSLANVWGTFWHDYIRQPCLGFSHTIAGFLQGPRRSPLAYSIHLTTAFVISAFFHTLSLLVVAEGHVPVRRLLHHMSCFFVAQPLAIVAESLVMSYYNRSQNSVADRMSKGPDNSTVSLFARIPPVVGYLIGYSWVASWLVVTGWWFVLDYVAIGVLEWPLPFTLWGKV